MVGNVMWEVMRCAILGGITVVIICVISLIVAGTIYVICDKALDIKLSRYDRKYVIEKIADAVCYKLKERDGDKND